MLNKIKQQLKNYMNDLAELDKRKVECKNCSGSGIIKNQTELLGSSFDIMLSCECQIINGLYRFEIENMINRLGKVLTEIKTDIPIEYQTGCFFEKIDDRIKDFLNNDKIFLWLHGITGTGKTYSIYALMLRQILKQSNIYKRFIRVKEIDFNYQTDIKQNIVIDDIGISENKNRNINLSDLYYELIDYKREYNQKLILTSNFEFSKWLTYISSFNLMNSKRIESRMSNVTQIIKLDGVDMRKLKQSTVSERL